MPVVVIGAKSAADHLREMGDRAKNLEPAWPRVGNMLSQRVRQQFLTNGAYFGTPWKPLTPKYKLWKLRHGFPGDILRQTGETMRSFTDRPMNHEVYEPKRAEFGSDTQKAVWHQYGTHRNGKQVNPPRKMLVMTRRNREDAKAIIKRYILGGRA